jgi:hypothetical protein
MAAAGAPPGAGDPAAIALLAVAGYMEESAADVEAQPAAFWAR